MRSGAEEDEEIKLCKLRSAAVQELLTDSRTLEVFLGAEKQQEDDGILAWFALSTEEDPTHLLKEKDPSSFFLQGAMPGLLRLSDDDAGGLSVKHVTETSAGEELVTLQNYLI